ncbi:uncharacterized protein [Oryza sativa Japonica Group]|jgi:hypothetical protein|uniref:Os08g0230600 protein n=7 Tax=Oryza TaxID=4527 RepID=A0A0P0XD55_ORYSJ|nr:uncharacterized protein LOC4344996 [Oryza sativa Japonica Group]XP_052165897.1 uncharacterized protein LOC127782669 [Oryza glaberrima]EAZ06091.1 hypothetical protein OsI_28327 [Oryza sativa Indica Group]KAB8107845.1 hypothetical protein EE612_042907 [Oryza sativa]EAZ41950.1 hypothetical protein OsJ_26495 [Oryza sativa Japonica Group]KAF2918686.1 hypothetical protein DAI22_08g075200 [Oryza sativa Japonica Group]BAD01252.1 unknown protein [Oryza sativa Japonica Group]|eukprot:NP_001061300.1 Os08g0230600 [Oryza sativa Japonica Group]
MAMVEAARRAMGWCGAEEERETASRKAPGACPRCGGAVVATDVESSRRILCLPLCLRNKKKFSCSRCRRALVAIVSSSAAA